MPTLTGQLLFGFLFVTIGFIGGALVMAAWHARTSGEALPTSTEPDPDLDEEVQIFRSKTSSNLLFRLGDKTLTTRDSTDPAVVQYLIRLSGDINSWLGLDKSETITQKHSPEQKAENEEWQVEGNKELTPLQKISLPISTRKAEPIEVKPDSRTLSIVHQIDAILQEMLQDSKLNAKAIRLDENPSHEVIVWVGVTRYEGIENVPDLEVKSLIKRAVDQWEKQSAAEK